MIFQEPGSSLNPVRTIGGQIVEAVRLHARLDRRAARARAAELLAAAGVGDAIQRLDQYPHQLSGGLQQRAMIAMALAGDPKVLIADEPTTALDVTIQAQILELLADLKRRLGLAILFITHDLSLAAGVADRVAVMYAGRIVEQAPVARVFAEPAHPYTAALLAAVPRMDRPAGRLTVVPGQPPPATDWPPGCRFRPRCRYAWARCADEPAVQDVAAGHQARCWLVAEPARRTP
jgi:oligopeptide/dipeptide ABC transporter ATP-binding protein